ncbi:MAG: hypothetical protein H0W62_03195 [Chitinophagales bacterium]|nr:hypothetical protein [Chitinophagales bacterium]
MNIATNSQVKRLFPNIESGSNGSSCFYCQEYGSLTDRYKEWDQFLPKDHPLQSSHLLFLEKSVPRDLEFRYAFIYENISGGDVPLIAVFYLQIVHFNSKHYLSPFSNQPILHQLEKVIIGRERIILTLGNLFRVDFPGAYWNPSVSTKEIAMICNKYLKSFKPKAHIILIKDTVGELGNELYKYGFQHWNNDLTMKMDINLHWKSFEDYISSLRHKYAQRARRSRAKLRDVKRTELSLDEIIHYSARIEKLYLQVVQKQPIRMVIASKNYFIEMKLAYQNQFKVFGYFKEDALIAFSSNILYESSWELHYIGFDYGQNAEHWLYFNIMFDAIADAISEGKKELELGRTAREAKAIIGGRPIYFESYYKIRTRFTKYLVRILTDFFNKNTGKDWEKHHPFKPIA